MPEAPLTQQQLDMITDIIGGMLGQDISSVLPQQKSYPTKAHEPTTRAHQPRGPQKIRVNAPKPQTPNQAAANPVRTHPPAPTPTAQTPAPKPPEDQQRILDMLKRESQEYSGMGYGTELAHWLRTHPIPSAVTSQFQAAGVPDLDTLEALLNQSKVPENSVPLNVFHDDDSPFVILSQPGQTLVQGGAPAVVVGPPFVGHVHSLEEAFPGTHFIAVDETPKELKRAATLLPKPHSSKALDNETEEVESEQITPSQLFQSSIPEVGPEVEPQMSEATPSSSELEQQKVSGPYDEALNRIESTLSYAKPYGFVDPAHDTEAFAARRDVLDCIGKLRSGKSLVRSSPFLPDFSKMGEIPDQQSIQAQPTPSDPRIQPPVQPLIQNGQVDQQNQQPGPPPEAPPEARAGDVPEGTPLPPNVQTYTAGGWIYSFPSASKYHSKEEYAHNLAAGHSYQGGIYNQEIYDEIYKQASDYWDRTRAPLEEQAKIEKEKRRKLEEKREERVEKRKEKLEEKREKKVEQREEQKEKIAQELEKQKAKRQLELAKRQVERGAFQQPIQEKPIRKALSLSPFGPSFLVKANESEVEQEEVQSSEKPIEQQPVEQQPIQQPIPQSLPQQELVGSPVHITDPKERSQLELEPYSSLQIPKEEQIGVGQEQESTPDELRSQILSEETEARELLLDRFNEDIEVSNVEDKDLYRGLMKKAVSRLSKVALERVIENTRNGMTLYDTRKEVHTYYMERIRQNISIYELYPEYAEYVKNCHEELETLEKDLERGYWIAGFYSSKGELVLDLGSKGRMGGSGAYVVNEPYETPENKLINHTYTHELGHAIDNRELSTTTEWIDSWVAEIVDKGLTLTQYAQLNEGEGFAEFSRLLYCGYYKMSDIERSFPMCSSFFKKNNLWPTGE